MGGLGASAKQGVKAKLNRVANLIQRRVPTAVESLGAVSAWGFYSSDDARAITAEKSTTGPPTTAEDDTTTSRTSSVSTVWGRGGTSSIELRV
ncbi:hypothetical protein NPX13_g7997 [Xylaria arbuscula]|uniref:Uncharacterized protein n=1 Tax=Xylaria arbuscula TaxID=114810 RepID=A0A9W8TK87_9PEZI|nr:hypothetical protein NPX13_g7997 [Xylaria arbuscula]